MEDRIRVPGGIVSVPDADELDLDALDDVAGGLDRAWQTDGAPMAEPGSRSAAAASVLRG